MGALPRIKEKKQFRYRKGSTNESNNCRYCKHRRSFPIAGGEVELRCVIMGIRASTRYRVRPDFTCDTQLYNRPAEGATS